MRSNRRAARGRGRGDNSFWLSFSDLMSSLVLIIILVMFYIIYQYFNMAEVSEAELASRQAQLDQTQEELEAQRVALTDAEEQMLAQQEQLDTQQEQLDAQQEELDAARAALDTREEELSSAQTRLDEQDSRLAAQQSELEAAQQQLAAQQGELEAAQQQLAAQQGELEAAQSELQSAQSELQSAQVALEQQQVQIEQLVGMRTRIITSLSDALRSSNISATVDTATGSITLESDVMFATGKYELTPEGRRFIDRLLPVYLDVLFSPEYRGYVSEIIIEGHTDSVGGYLPNLELSQQRALAVASYVLGDDCRTVSADVKNQLRQVVTVNGRSYSDRVFDERGVEDRDASRRVVFKFRLTDEQMIQQLRTILEGEP